MHYYVMKQPKLALIPKWAMLSQIKKVTTLKMIGVNEVQRAVKRNVPDSWLMGESA